MCIMYYYLEVKISVISLDGWCLDNVPLGADGATRKSKSS